MRGGYLMAHAAYFRERCRKRPKFWLPDVFSPLLFEFLVENLQKLKVSEIFTKNQFFERRHHSIGISNFFCTFATMLMHLAGKLQTNVYDLQKFRGPYDHPSSSFRFLKIVLLKGRPALCKQPFYCGSNSSNSSQNEVWTAILYINL